MSNALTIWRPQRNHIYCTDALTLCASLPPGSVDLIATDPPYFRVADTEWDKQWKTAADFLAWLESIVIEFKRVLKPNGSLYMFASPQMSAQVEVMTGKHFNVLNNIRWVKHGTMARRIDRETLRSYLSSWEAVIFAEHHGSDSPYQDALIDGNSTYWGACETAKVSIFGDYLTAEFTRAKVSRRQIARLFPSKTGNLTGCVSNWILGYNIPTPEQYAKIRAYLNGLNGSSDYLRREYEDLRREYEDLRREYEDLRRPFNSTSLRQHFDIWHFDSVPPGSARHETQKPLPLMRHIVLMSSKPGAVVFDPFCGSGATAEAARRLGRDYICGDTSAEYVELARRRVNPEFGKAPKRQREPEPLEELPLFSGASI